VSITYQEGVVYWRHSVASWLRGQDFSPEPESHRSAIAPRREV